MLYFHKVIAIFVFGYCICVGQTYATFNVLLLNSYHPQYQWTDELTQGVKDSLALTIKPESLYIEFMDKRRFVDDPIYESKLIDLLQYKYQHKKPDIVITSDDAAYFFMLRYGKKLFPNVPIVFSGVNIFDPQLIAGQKNITGIAEGMDILGNLNLIASLHPKLGNIIIIGDNTGLGLGMINAAKRIKQEWQSKSIHSGIELKIWNDFSLKELFQRVSNLPSDTAILILAIHKDHLGQYFSFTEHLPILSQESNVPIYGMWGALMIGHGAVGGMMNDPYEHGFNVGNIALKILSGTPVSQLKVQTSAVYKPRFDYQQLLRFNIDQNLLPKNSILFNSPISFYQQNKLFINIVLIVFITLVLLITFLVKNIRQRIIVENELSHFNQKLDSTVKERTSELEQRNNELQEMSSLMRKFAHTDSLTGLDNRRAAEKKISAYLKRYSVVFKPFALAILDIDHFKMVNDNFGHQVGDKVLKEIAITLTGSLRPSDHIYRWGGEEFLIALSETPHSEILVILNRLVDNISKINVDKVGMITASIGISQLIKGDCFDTIIKRADDALYQAKDTGRNKVVIG